MKSPREPQFARHRKVQLFCLKGRRVATKPSLQPPLHPSQSNRLLRPPLIAPRRPPDSSGSYKATPSTYR